MPDSFGALGVPSFDAWMNARLDPLGTRPQSAFPALPPEEQQSAIGNVLGKSMGLLEYVGQIFDKPGRAVRGALAGRPGELANLIPFSDALGITDPAKATSGRDLLDQAGLLSKNESGFLPWLAGFATDVATDPLSWIGPGGLTGIGKAAQKLAPGTVGALEKGLGRQIAAGQRDLLGIHFPFQHGSTIAGWGAGNEALGQSVSDAGLAFRESGPGRGLRSMFDPSVNGEIGAESQAAQSLLTGNVNQATREARATNIPLGNQAAEAVNAFTQSNPEIRQQAFQRAMDTGASAGDAEAIANAHMADLGGRSMRLAAEMQGRPEMFGALPTHQPSGLDVLQGARGALGQGAEGPLTQIQSAAQAMTGASGKLNSALEEMGAPVGWIENHAARFGANKDVADAANKFRQFRLRTGTMLGREEATKNLPDEVIRALRGDAAAHAAAPETMEAAVQHVLTNYAPWLKPGDELQHATSLVSWVAEHPGDKPIYKTLAESTKQYVEQNSVAKASWQSAHEFLGQNTVPLNTPGSVPLEQVFKTITPGMSDPDVERAMRFFAKTQLKDAPVQEAYKLAVPENYAAATRGLMKPVMDPEWRGLIGKTVDWINQGWSTHITLPFMAFITRNGRFAHAMNLLGGQVENPADAARYAQRAFGASKEALAGISQERNQLAELWGLQFVGKSGEGVQSAVTGVENAKPWNVKATLGESKQFVAENPLGTINYGRGPEETLLSGVGNKLGQLPGMQTVRTADRAMLETGRKANDMVKWSANMGYFDYLTQDKGWAPAAAAAEVNRVQFHYAGGRLSPFEKTYMKRLIPFYSFQKGVVQYVLSDLAKEPGGAIAQGIRATQAARQNGGFLPEYLGEGTAVPLNDQGRYFTGLDMPWERAFSTGVIGPTVGKTVGRTTERVISQMSPVPSTAYTMAAGRDPYTGRETSALYQYPTDSPLLNSVIHGSPATRAVSALRTAFDPRKDLLTKAVNLSGLGHITDVSGGLEHQKDIEARRVLGELMKEMPHLRSHVDFYADPAQRANLTPEEIQALRISSGLDKSGKEYAKKLKAAELLGAGRS